MAASATATATATATASVAPKLRFSCSDYRMSKPTKKLMGSTKFVIYTPNCSSSTRLGRSFPIRAFEPQKEQENDTAIISQEDLSYLWKLGAGSVIGAALIKYGSVLFPEITSPNIILALGMITTPIIVAVLLLIKQSRVE